MNWEEVERTENEVLSRVPLADGGWIYRYMQRTGSSHDGYTWSVSICFVPVAQAPVADPPGKPDHPPGQHPTHRPAS